jgi:hypothetical protein
MIRLLAALIMIIALSAAAVYPPDFTPNGPPDFTAKYENPIYAGNGEHGGPFDNYGARWFEFWKDGVGFAFSPQPTEAKNCLNKALYFCIHLAEFVFAMPPKGIRPGAMWWGAEGNNWRFRLLAIAKVRFRGKDIDIYSIKADALYQRKSPAYLSSVFSYSYELGVIGYAEVMSETFRQSEARSPNNLEAISALVSPHGLGGRENCRYWKCGSSVATQ